MGKGRRRSRETPDVEPDEVVEVPPVDVDGVRTVAVLTVLWAIGFVILAFRKDSLDASGNGWWLWTCLAGVGLGLLGLEYTRKRRDAIEFARLQAEADDDESPTSIPSAGADEAARAIRDALASPEPVAAPDPVIAIGPVGEPAAEPFGTPPAEAGPGDVSPHAVTRPIDTSGLRPPQAPLGFPADLQPDPAAPPNPAAVDNRRAPLQPPRMNPPSSEPRPTDIATGATPAASPPPAAVPSAGTDWPDDDEPLLETTLGGGRRARNYDMTEEVDEITEGGGTEYRGRRARRSDSA